jgi:hypothetical protein
MRDSVDENDRGPFSPGACSTGSPCADRTVGIKFSCLYSCHSNRRRDRAHLPRPDDRINGQRVSASSSSENREVTAIYVESCIESGEFADPWQNSNANDFRSYST